MYFLLLALREQCVAKDVAFRLYALKGQKALSTGQRPVGTRVLEERPERAKPYTNKGSRREPLSNV